MLQNNAGGSIVGKRVDGNNLFDAIQAATAIKAAGYVGTIVVLYSDGGTKFYDEVGKVFSAGGFLGPLS